GGGGGGGGGKGGGGGGRGGEGGKKWGGIGGSRTRPRRRGAAASRGKGPLAACARSCRRRRGARFRFVAPAHGQARRSPGRVPGDQQYRAWRPTILELRLTLHCRPPNSSAR